MNICRKLDRALGLTLGEIALQTPFSCELRNNSDSRIFFFLAVLDEFYQRSLHLRHFLNVSQTIYGQAAMGVVIGFVF